MKVRLTDDVRQDKKQPKEAPAFLVFGTADTMEEMFFGDYQSACDFAHDCMERSDEDDWDIFPLWAGNALKWN